MNDRSDDNAGRSAGQQRSRIDVARGVIQAWGRILVGRRPNLSVEITKECPLRCPGCYAYGDAHLGGDVTLRRLSDYRGDELVERFLALVDRHRPLHVSIVGGEPLVRYRELGRILPRLAARNIHVQVVTSAVRSIPGEWRAASRLMGGTFSCSSISWSPQPLSRPRCVSSGARPHVRALRARPSPPRSHTHRSRSCPGATR